MSRWLVLVCVLASCSKKSFPQPGPLEPRTATPFELVQTHVTSNGFNPATETAVHVKLEIGLPPGFTPRPTTDLGWLHFVRSGDNEPGIEVHLEHGSPLAVKCPGTGEKEVRRGDASVECDIDGEVTHVTFYTGIKVGEDLAYCRVSLGMRDEPIAAETRKNLAAICDSLRAR